MCQFWQATRLMVQDWHRVNQPLGATEFSCFHVRIFPDDEESVIGTDSAFCSTLSCWSAGVIGTMSSSASDGILESLESRGSLFLIHIHVIMPSSIRTFHRTNLKNNQYRPWKYLPMESNSLTGSSELFTSSSATIPFSKQPSDTDSWNKISMKENNN